MRRSGEAPAARPSIRALYAAIRSYECRALASVFPPLWLAEVQASNPDIRCSKVRRAGRFISSPNFSKSTA